MLCLTKHRSAPVSATGTRFNIFGAKLNGHQLRDNLLGQALQPVRDFHIRRLPSYSYSAARMDSACGQILCIKRGGGCMSSDRQNSTASHCWPRHNHPASRRLEQRRRAPLRGRRCSVFAYTYAGEQQAFAPDFFICLTSCLFLRAQGPKESRVVALLSHAQDGAVQDLCPHTVYAHTSQRFYDRSLTQGQLFEVQYRLYVLLR